MHEATVPSRQKNLTPSERDLAKAKVMRAIADTGADVGWVPNRADRRRLAAAARRERRAADKAAQ